MNTHVRDNLNAVRTSIFASKTSTTGNVGTGDDTLWSFSLPANEMADGDVLWVHAEGAFAANTNSKTLKLWVGATSYCQMLSAYTQNLANNRWNIDIYVHRHSSTNLLWSGSGTFGEQDKEVDQTNHFGGSESTDINFASSQTVKITGAGTSDNDLQIRTGFARILRA
jgi:hypothetical protein